jgi:flagellar hook assembly protein FlgD
MVYDLAGRHVRTLADRVCEPGQHEVTWDGRNERGERVGSGVYFLRLEDGHSVSSKKLVLLK